VTVKTAFFTFLAKSGFEEIAFVAFQTFSERVTSAAVVRA
jgi:hypothetical protein